MNIDFLQKILPYVVFISLHKAVEDGYLIKKEHKKDKEFFFQNWIKKHIMEALKFFCDIELVEQGRNTFPDFLIRSVATKKPIQGYEVKGLAFPGRSDFDANSKLPRGRVRRRDGTEYDVYYIFGRYPKTDETEYTLVDLVVFHGNLLNADNWYQHKNLHIKGFGSYGDIMIRDRKMYVPKTPYALLSGIEKKRTLIVPDHIQLEELLSQPDFDKIPTSIANALKKDLVKIGEVVRTERKERIIAYKVNLEKPSIEPYISTANSHHGEKKHVFMVYTTRKFGSFEVSLK